jgi:hypothetical protein
MLFMWVPTYTYLFQYQTQDISISMNLTVPCDTRGDLTPACSAARQMDNWLMGSAHLYPAAEFQRMPECSTCSPAFCPRTFEDGRAPWCDARLDPEGALSSFPVILTAMCGYHFGSVLLYVKV